MRTFKGHIIDESRYNPKGKTHSEMEKILRQIFNDNYLSVEDGGEDTFEGMVDMMAGDKFYKAHKLAKAYKETEDWVNEK